VPPDRRKNGKNRTHTTSLGVQSRLNVIVWAHSDQAGGAELASVVARSFVEAGLPLDTVGIACPGPWLETVVGFFRNEPIQVASRNFIETEESLRLAKGTNGRVDAEATYNLLQKAPFRQAASGSFQNLDRFILRQVALIRGRTHKNTLIISCGEPVAVKVAKQLGLKCVIITDHLLTATVRWVLQHGGRFDRKMADLLTRFEDWDRMADEAFLSPAEFGGTDYDSYLAHGSIHCNYVGGLFYEPLSKAALEANPFYDRLRRSAREKQVVFVFGGGGPVWLGVYKKLHDEARTAQLKYDCVLLVPTVVGDGHALRRKKDGSGTYLYDLYIDGRRMQLADPGRLMYWYAGCHLFVGRGGLAAQQIFATMMSDIETAPEMLFIEEPGHPQIEHERQSLYNLGFVETRTLDRFMDRPLEVINSVLDNIKPNETRLRVQARYGARMLTNVARALVHSYKPVAFQGSQDARTGGPPDQRVSERPNTGLQPTGAPGRVRAARKVTRRRARG